MEGERVTAEQSVPNLGWPRLKVEFLTGHNDAQEQNSSELAGKRCDCRFEIAKLVVKSKHSSMMALRSV